MKEDIKTQVKLQWWILWFVWNLIMTPNLLFFILFAVPVSSHSLLFVIMNKWDFTEIFFSPYDYNRLFLLRGFCFLINFKLNFYVAKNIDNKSYVIKNTCWILSFLSLIISIICILSSILFWNSNSIPFPTTYWHESYYNFIENI